MPPALQKKLGPLKVWQWALIGAALGAAIVVYRKAHGGGEGGEPTGEVFGGTGTGAFGAIDPETGIPYQFEGGGAAGGETLDQFLANVGKLSDAGLLPTGGEGGEPGEGPIETIIETINPAPAPPGQAKKAKASKEKREQGNKHPATSTGAAAAAGGNSHASAPHPAQRTGLAGAVGLTGPGKGTVQGLKGGVAHVGGAGGATGGVVHAQARSSGIGAGHPKPAAPAGYHTYKGDNGQWWFAPNN